MKSSFQARLVNGPFGDPGLHIHLRWQGQAIQFDLGRLDRFPAAQLLDVTHVFVSHTHMDHFYGFDRLLRLLLARDTTIEIFGPRGIQRNVLGKLQGYTWNLVEGYPLTIVVHEITGEQIHTISLPATHAFEPQARGVREFNGVLAEGDGWRVRCAQLNHKIPCLAFALEEDMHLNVRTDELERLPVGPGPWLNELKAAVRRGDDDATPIVAWEGRRQARREFVFPLGELRERLLTVTPGQKVGYVVDTLFSRENADRIVQLVGGADVFYCESLFLDIDREEALKRYHLTARQAGTLARLAKAKRLEVFHFSPRYERRAEELYQQADAVFRGDLPTDTPVDIPG